MMKRAFVFIVIFSGLMLIGVVPIRAQPVDTAAWWLLADVNPDTRSQADFDALTELLIDRGNVPSDQIRRIEGEGGTHKSLHNAIRNLARRMKRGDRLIFFFRGAVTKPARSNSIYLLTYGAESSNLTSAVEDIQLNRWFREAGVNEVIVLFDAYTDDGNIYAYLANRELLGTAALVSIRPATSTEDSLLQNLPSALQTDASDLDDNRQITVGELHEYIIAQTPPQESIVVPIGNVNTAVFGLIPMLKITTVPEGASVFLNGEDIGATPQRLIDNLKRGSYEIEVKKQAYLIPPTRAAKIDLIQGEAVEVSWALKPIAVYGKITLPAAQALEQVDVWLEDTVHKQTVGSDGNYRFADWTADDILSIGKTYTLKAESAELYHAEATFTFEGYDSIQRDLTLAEKTWFEVAQLRFDQRDNEAAIAAFQNGIEITTDFPPLSPELTVLLFNSFSAAVDSMDIENIAYLVTTAKLSDRFGNTESAKIYWGRVKSRAAKGTSEHKLATKRLWELNLRRYLTNIALIVLLVIVLISGGYTLQKYYRGKRSSV